MRVLLSEGSSTSAREAITVLGLTGHRVEICDPDPHCLGRFSRFVQRFHRCPAVSEDPQGYLSFVEALLSRERLDVLIPIHEQGLLFAVAPERWHALTRIALPSFASYRTAHSKAGFSRLLDELGLPQPLTRFVRSAQELHHVASCPCVVKTAIGTASRGTWIVHNPDDLAIAIADLIADGATAPDGELLVQDHVTGTIEHAQAVFSTGRLVAMHAYRQIVPGAGGGDAIKESIERGDVRAHLARLGERLWWHGALSVDYIWREGGVGPQYIDCNPRLVEPMSAYLAGLDLVELLLQISSGKSPAAAPRSRAGVRTHLGMQCLLRCGLRGGTRRELLGELGRLVTGAGSYANSREELTPVRMDWLSAVPLMLMTLILLIRPRWAGALPRRYGAHLLSVRSIQLIEREVAV
jgi:predicted ATP-grasp superfamily ATP-dependent carboligase